MAERWNPLPALEFLTIVRVRRWRPAEVESLAQAQAFYPLVGLLLGGVLALVDVATDRVLPEAPRAVLALILLAVLTRGLHLDGLADTFDGLLGGSTPQRRLEIMRDPRLGSFGATALMLTLLLQWGCLASLAGDVRRPGLILFPALGRLAMVVAVAAVPYAREQGLGMRYHEAARGLPLVVALLTALVASGVALGAGGLVLLLVAAGCGYAVGRWAKGAAGGATGDVYGAACILGEAAVLLCLAGWSYTGAPVPGGWR